MAKASDLLRVHVAPCGDIQEDPKGRFFFDESHARFFDLSGVNLLRLGVDTVRQLYKGMLRPEVLCLFDQPGIVRFAGHAWHVSRIGRDSGYQYKLQNADLGFVLLLKNFNVKQDVIGPHLKIEVSPHAIDCRSPAELQTFMDSLAGAILTHCEPNQCAVHLALDVQGWTPPADMTARMHCRATNQRRFDGVASFEFADKAVTYGAGQSFLWGSAGGCQLGIYNKTLQAKAIDKLDYWESVWRRGDSFEEADPANYDPESPVWRIEFRYHHSVVEQFAQGSACTASGEFIQTRTFAEFAPHLDGLWRYGFGNFRLLARPGVFDPAWTLFRDDVRVETGLTSLLDDTEYRRYYKTARGFSGRNVDLMMGNFVSLLARQGVGAKKGFEALKSLPVWDVVSDYYAGKDLSERDIYRKLRDALEERTIRWGRAV